MADPVNPQNVNNSQSPGGDGVQSAASESRSLNPSTNQPVQNRVNAAVRREQGQRSGLVQTPGEVLPGDNSTHPINVAEQGRKDAAEAERGVDQSNLPKSTLAEMEAGRKALDRNKPRNEAVEQARSGGDPVKKDD